MSAFLYGRLTRTAEETPEIRLAEDAADDTPAQKAAALAQRVAALVPADILAIHMIVLAAATELGDDGSTTVTNPALLKWTLPILMVLGIALYVIGRTGGAAWKRVDSVRACLPAVAFLAWTMLTGTSAATPWFEGTHHGWVSLIGAVVAVLALAVAARVTPKEGGGQVRESRRRPEAGARAT